MATDLNAPRILLVDDERHIVETLTEFLENEFTILTASNGADGLAILHTIPIDVIISDQRMPEMNGIEFLKQSLDIAPQSERILITAYADLTNVIQSVNEAKVSYYLTKPIDPQQIRLVVQHAAEVVRLRHTNAALVEELRQNNQMLEQKVEQRNQELQQINDQLHRMQKIREQMIHMAVHDLKSPLFNIQLTLAELDRLCETPDAHDMIALIRDSADIAYALVIDMLSVAALGSRQSDTRYEPVEPAALLTASIQAFSLAALKKKIYLHADYPTNLPSIPADARKLREAFDNLISNAIKYTYTDGQIRISARTDGECLVISIRDTGLGMTPEDIRDAFGEFKRLSAQPTAGESSTGLGLFIVKQIIEQHHGTITVESEGPDQGSIFTIRLPLQEVPQ